MATVKVKFRPSTVEAREGTLFFSVTHDRIEKQIPAQLKLHPTEWDNFRSEVVIRPDTDE